MVRVQVLEWGYNRVGTTKNNKEQQRTTKNVLHSRAQRSFRFARCIQRRAHYSFSVFPLVTSPFHIISQHPRCMATQATLSHPGHHPLFQHHRFASLGPLSLNALQSRNARLRRQLNAATAKNTYQVMVNRRQRDTIDELRKEVDKLRAERGMLVRAVTGGEELTEGMFEKDDGEEGESIEK